MIKLDKLLETRLLIQANSGGGKSWSIRKLLEDTHGKVQQIVLDIEGDFASLREKYDFILAGKGGDIDANPRTAELLAHKVLELNVSIIIDLYELKQPERIKFVAKFLDAMTNAPKSLWHPVIVVIDEAHIFCPENGQAESSGAVIDLCTRGRKRGFCAVLATQRLSKLNKDAAAECINKMIGRTGLDIDMKRAADELGFSKSDALKLRDLEPGEFFVFGPALSKSVERQKTGPVRTKHPKAGKSMRAYTPAPPTSKVKGVLSKLSDLPREAEKELKDKQSMLTRIRELEIQLRKAPKPEVDQETINRAVKNAKQELSIIFKENIKKLKAANHQAISELEASLMIDAYSTVGVWRASIPQVQNIPRKPIQLKDVISVDVQPFGKMEKLILSFLCMKVGFSFTKSQIGVMTGYVHSSGSFNNGLSKLRQAGLIQGTDKICINRDELQRAQSICDGVIDPGSGHPLRTWLDRLGKCERSIYEKLVDNPGSAYSKEVLGDITGYSHASGSFNNSISKLCTLGLASRIGNNVQLNPELDQIP